MAIPKSIIKKIKEEGDLCPSSLISQSQIEGWDTSPEVTQVVSNYLEANKGREIYYLEAPGEEIDTFLNKFFPRTKEFMNKWYDKYFHVAISKDMRILDYNEDSSCNYNFWYFAV